MTTRPINLAAPEVRAAQAGTLVEVRRRIEPQPVRSMEHTVEWTGIDAHYPRGWRWSRGDWSMFIADGADEPFEDALARQCPLWKVGDLLWVREAWSHDAESLAALRVEIEDLLGSGGHGPYYRADGTHENSGLAWWPASTMRRWVSRLTLEVTAVRVERDEVGWWWVAGVRRVG